MAKRVYGFNSREDLDRISNAVLHVERSVLTRHQAMASSARGTGTTCILCKPDADIAADTSGTCSVYYGATKGSESDTTQNITGYTRQDLVTGQWCLAVGLANGWELVPLEC